MFGPRNGPITGGNRHLWWRRAGRRLRCLQLIALGLVVAPLSCPGAAWTGSAPGHATQRGRLVPPVAPAMPEMTRLWAALSTAAAGAAAASSPAYAYETAAEAPTANSGVPLACAALILIATFASVFYSGEEPGSLKEKTDALYGRDDVLYGREEKEDDKQIVTDYFNGEGFGRWKSIYGESEDVNPVQRDIRVGHAKTVEKILGWLDGVQIAGQAVCDAGCGTGNLSIPLAERGALVSGSDISSAMVSEAERRAQKVLEESQMPQFETQDLEALRGEFDCVCCVDVLIHYPPERLEGMVGQLAGLSRDRVILSFAPKTWYYILLKQIGELFPGKSKTTRAYLHEEEVVEQAFRRAGFQITRKEMTSTNFYFSRLFEARPIAATASS